MNPTPPGTLLTSLQAASVAVIGDFALDAYWHLAAADDEFSLETGLPVHQVRSQTYGLGGAGNVCANLVALGVAQVHAVGCIGDDLFGHALRARLDALGVSTAGLRADQPDWQTAVYTKPQIDGVEQPRFDLGAFNRPTETTIEAITGTVAGLVDTCDACVINQQLLGGLVTPAMIEALDPVLWRRDVVAATPVVVDARHRMQHFSSGVLKLNEAEARTVMNDRQDDPADDMAAFAHRLAAEREAPVFITRGADGMLCAADGQVYDVPAHRIDGEGDPVGAGDTVTAVLAAALAVGTAPADAARFANFAAAVVVGKIGTTGTARPDEILALAAGR